MYGTPVYLRSDNGVEFIALALRNWLADHAIEPLYIDPGCRGQNGKDERFNGTVRDECLNMQLFGSLVEARIRLEAFRQHYNSERPHSALRIKHHLHSSKRGMRPKISSGILSFLLD